MKKIILIFQIFLISVIFYSCESNDTPVTNSTSNNLNSPDLLSPVNHSALYNVFPTFDWSDVNNASKYNLQVSNDSTFTSIALDTTILGVSQFTITANILNDSSSYFWRVKSINSSSVSNWSANFNFSILVNANIPTLISPPINSIISTFTPSFDWSDVPSATSYDIQISSDSLFTSLVIDSSGIISSEYSLTNNVLTDYALYYWRVRGIISPTPGPWSTNFNFTTYVVPINPTNKVLIEMFTNTSCIPCVEANTYLDEIYNLNGVTSNDANVVILRYHTTLFAGDPFYLYNITDNQARMTFYPNSAIVNPRTFLLGAFMGNFSSDPWTNKINVKLSETRTYAIKLTNTYDLVSRNGNINVKIRQVSGEVFNDLVYQIAVAENEIPFNAQNGETIFNNTFRDFITPPDGQPFTISPGQTKSYNQSYSVDNQINQDKTDLIVFVQRNNNSGKDIFAVEKVSLK
jgi:hypothetical protein